MNFSLFDRFYDELADDYVEYKSRKYEFVYCRSRSPVFRSTIINIIEISVSKVLEVQLLSNVRA